MSHWRIFDHSQRFAVVCGIACLPRDYRTYHGYWKFVRWRLRRKEIARNWDDFGTVPG